MAEEPEHSRWGARLRERTQPLQPDDENYGWAHATLCETMAQSFLQVAELIDPPDPWPPWGPLFDLAVCPPWALPWLAQAVGIDLPTGIDPDQARTIIQDAAGHNVGTVKAMKAAIMLTLVESDPGVPPEIVIRERDGGNAYQLEIVTWDKNTPDPALTQQAIIAAKPGALVLRYRDSEGWDYQLMTDEGGTYATQSTTYTSYANLTERQPG